MKNKNSLYIVIGLGAGVLAYYLFCKKKVQEKQEEVEKEVEEKQEEKNKTQIGGVKVSPIGIPKYTIPVATTTPVIVNVSSTKPTTATITPTTTPTVTTSPTTTTAVAVKPTEMVIAPKPIETSLEPVKTTTTTSDVKPLSTTSTMTSSAVMTSAPLAKSSFEGMGSNCFEVGYCLNDL